MTNNNAGTLTTIGKVDVIGKVDRLLVIFKNATLAYNIEYADGEDGSEYFDRLDQETQELLIDAARAQDEDTQRELTDQVYNRIETEQASLDRISQFK